MFDDIIPKNAPFDGRWWAPENSSEVVGGRISLIDGVWELVLNGWLGPWSPGTFENEIPPVIHGSIGTVPITLIDLVSGGRTGGLSGRPFETRVSANVVIVGVHGESDMKFISARIRYHNLNEWVFRSPWTTSFGSMEDPPEATISYKDPGELRAEVPGAALVLTRSLQMQDDLEAATLRSSEWLHFEFDEALGLKTIEWDYLRPMRNFLELAVNDDCPVIGFQLVREASKEPFEKISILSSLHRGGPLEKKHWFRVNFNSADVKFDEVLPAWWLLQAELGSTTDLLASLRNRNFVGNNFLTAATAMESYHRHRHTSTVSKSHQERLDRIKTALEKRDSKWLSRFLSHSHEPNYGQRIDEIVAEAGEYFSDAVGNKAKWRDWIVKARNGTAHRGPGMINVDQEWIVTIRIAASIQILMSIVLMNAIGVPHEVFEERILRSGDLRFVSDQLRQLVPEWFKA